MDRSEETNLRPEGRDADFLALLSRHELQLAACAHSIVPIWQDAEEVLQATRVTLWRRFDDFQPGTNFLAWARSVVRNQARTLAREKGRRSRVFGEALTDMLLGQLADRPAEDDSLWQAYMHCAQKLGSEARDLLRRCYTNSQRISDIAAELGRSLAGTYKALSRVRRGLMTCVQEQLRKEQVQ